MPTFSKRDGTWMARWGRNGRQYTECGFLSKNLATKFEKRIKKLSKKKWENWWKEKHALKETDKKERMLFYGKGSEYFRKYKVAAAAKAKADKLTMLAGLTTNFGQEDVVCHGTTKCASEGMRADQGGNGLFEARLASYLYSATSKNIVIGDKKKIFGAFVNHCPAAAGWLANSSLVERKRIQFMSAITHALRKFETQYFGKRNIGYCVLYFSFLLNFLFTQIFFWLNIVFVYIFVRNNCDPMHRSTAHVIQIHARVSSKLWRERSVRHVLFH